MHWTGRCAWFGGLSLVLGACASDDSASVTDTSSSSGSTDSTGVLEMSTSSSGVDTSGGGESSSESSDTGSTVADCMADLTLGENFALVEGETTQVHPFIAFDEEHQGVWVAYTRRASENSSNLATAVARFGCDGSVQMPAWTASTSDANHTDPELVVADDRVLVIWAADDGTGGDGNLDVVTRVLDREGAPLSEQEQPVVLTRDGAPFAGSAWMVHAAANPDGTFVVAGTRAIEEVSAFQLFVQRLDADGQAAGPTIEPALQPGYAHTEPRIAIGSDGVAHVAWSRTADFETYQVSTLSLGPDDDGSDISAVVLGDEGDHAAVASAELPLWANSAAEGGGRGIRVWPATDGTALSLGTDGAIDHTPSVGLDGSTAIVAWYRLLSGARNEIFVAGIEGLGGDALTATRPEVLADVEAAPYPLALTPVGDGIYLLAWSEGDSPDFVMRGRFIDLG